jgi:hypothetical protein
LDFPVSSLIQRNARKAADAVTYLPQFRTENELGAGARYCFYAGQPHPVFAFLMGVRLQEYRLVIASPSASMVFQAQVLSSALSMMLLGVAASFSATCRAASALSAMMVW